MLTLDLTFLPEELIPHREGIEAKPGLLEEAELPRIDRDQKNAGPATLQGP